jgi:hypothetical protein
MNISVLYLDNLQTILNFGMFHFFGGISFNIQQNMKLNIFKKFGLCFKIYNSNTT